MTVPSARSRQLGGAPLYHHRTPRHYPPSPRAKLFCHVSATAETLSSSQAGIDDLRAARWPSGPRVRKRSFSKWIFYPRSASSARCRLRLRSFFVGRLLYPPRYASLPGPHFAEVEVTNPLAPPLACCASLSCNAHARRNEWDVGLRTSSSSPLERGALPS